MSRIYFICFLLWLFLLIFTQCKGNSQFRERNVLENKQNEYILYYEKVYKADSLFIVKDYEEAYRILHDLFKIYEPLNMEVYRDYHTYIAAATAIGRIEDIRDLVKNSFSIYGSTINEFKKDSLLNEALNTSDIDSLKIIELQNLYERGLNMKLRERIEKMIEEDQELRKEKQIDTEKLKILAKKHERELKQILTKYAYPDSKLIGFYNYNQKDVDLNAVYLHTSTDFKEKILLPILKSNIKNGKCLPRVYASVYDRNLLNNKGYQYFGSYYDSKGDLMPLSNIENKNKLDSIRKSIGLPNVDYNKWRTKEKFGIEFNFNP